MPRPNGFTASSLNDTEKGHHDDSQIHHVAPPACQSKETLWRLKVDGARRMKLTVELIVLVLAAGSGLIRLNAQPPLGQRRNDSDLYRFWNQ